MNTCFLLSVPFLGFVWLGLLFLVCFIGVHVARLARLGLKVCDLPKRRSAQKSPQAEKPPEKPQEKKPSPAQSEKEPVYYIVERKRRSKSSFSEPKEIRFK